MIARHGRGPAGLVCRTCASFGYHSGGRRNYSKCRRYGITSGPGTDWSGRYAACGLYTARVSGDASAS